MCPLSTPVPHADCSALTSDLTGVWRLLEHRTVMGPEEVVEEGEEDQGEEEEGEEEQLA